MKVVLFLLLIIIILGGLSLFFQFKKFLYSKKVDHIIFTGVDARVRVDRTIKADLNRDYKATVISDAIATKDDANLMKKIQEFKEIGATITTTKELLAQYS